MADQREFGGRQRPDGDPGRAGPGRASAEMIEAVSGLLAGKKAALDRPPAPARVAFPDVSRSLGEVLRRSEGPSAARSRSVDSPASLEPPPVRLPDAGTPEGPSHRDHPEQGPGKVASTPPGPSIPSVELKTGSPPVVRDVPPASPPASGPVGQGGDASGSSRSAEVGGPRVIPRAANVVAAGGSPAGGVVADQQPHREPGLARRFEPGGLVGEDDRADRRGVVSSSKSVAVDLPHEPGGVGPATAPRDFPGPEAAGAGTSLPTVAVDRRPSPGGAAGPATATVRGPQAAELKNLSLAGSPSSDAGGIAPGRGGKGRESVDNPSGQASPSQGGATVDLSKTNDLLQQLIDAVRKQRGPSLPTGGPPVYPER